MIGGKGGGATEKIPGLSLIGTGDFTKLFEAGIGQKLAQVAEGILVRQEINTQFTAA